VSCLVILLLRTLFHCNFKKMRSCDFFFLIRWCLQAEKDFMIYDDVEKLYKRHSKILDIACVVEKNIDGAFLVF